MILKRYALSASVLAVFSLSAHAADLAPQPVEPAAPIAVAYSWTGFYAGVNGGYAFGSGRRISMTETETSDPTYAFRDFYGKLSPKGGFGGIQAGYNMQFGSFILGLEGDIQGAGISDKETATALTDDYIVTTKSQTNWFGTVRPRVGYAFDNILIYATGGVAFGGVKYKQDYTDPTGGTPYLSYPHKNDTRVGYTLGGGIEYGITQNWTVKLEYQYVNLGSTTLHGNESYGGTPTDYYIHTKLRNDFHTIRLGINYRF